MRGPRSRTTLTRALLGSAVGVALTLIAPGPAAFGHAERPSLWPEHDKGSVPVYRTTGPKLIVCKSDSAQRIRQIWPQRGKRPARPARPRRGASATVKARYRSRLRAYQRRTRTFERRNRTRLQRLGLVKQCRFQHIQAAVNAAKSGDRIQILPGLYQEEPSQPAKRDPSCGEILENGAPSYAYQFKCPNADNLIAVMGDSPDDPDKVCDQKCNLQIEGMGKEPRDVTLRGQGYGEVEGAKLNLIRADRADGIYLRNFYAELSNFNNIYALETNGFVFQDIVSAYSFEYAILSFASDNGLYDRIDAFSSGDSSIYPGSGPEGHCKWYGIEVRHSKIHGSPIGLSGTAGNGWNIHHNQIYDNVTGIGLDSFTGDHPGQPQDCSKFENNDIYSNNADFMDDERTAYCQNTPPEKRDPKKVCPTYLAFPGVGAIIGGGNGNLFKDNRFWDNWRFGLMQIYVPAILRGDPGDEDPLKQFETSNENRFVGNIMSERPDGTRDPNGRDFWWDEEGAGNCWEGNRSKGAGAPNDPAMLPTCPGNPLVQPPNPYKYGFLATCTQFHPTSNPDPIGCMVDGKPFYQSVPEPR